ncbi:MAG: hypothetical protein LBP50_07595 [Tannerella sp.]|jgi:hypothetical protein|nr:hypothetical protein [Tannerella sp.]
MIVTTNLIIVLIVAATICTLLFLAGYFYRENPVTVRTVHAGSGDNHTFRDDRSNVRITSFDTFYSKGKKVDPKKYDVRIAEGDCMAARGIGNGDILFIRRFGDGGKKNLNPGDILFIRKEKDEHLFCKIRGFHHPDEKGRAITFYYGNDNRFIESSSPYDMDKIDGIAEMKFENKL